MASRLARGLESKTGYTQCCFVVGAVETQCGDVVDNNGGGDVMDVMKMMVINDDMCG